eukprot:CAMPEP_0180150730 /NCGR_PEP_ID=MMETSP0986-20121125/21678_1 /TAXON_ID=697907 /ORGANISM="non described non described, Strain CCMP2293" /LENGTH=263 /DNA_ID=CAMNT_0022097831 /DNA_START=1 /DNA_END=792 /DNA_ORIENTATION=+
MAAAEGASHRRAMPQRLAAGAALLVGAALTMVAVVAYRDSATPSAVALMTEERALKMDNFLAQHAVSQFSDHGQEGFQDEGGFKRASAGVSVDLAKLNSEHDKFAVLDFSNDKNMLDADNRKSLSNLDVVTALGNAHDQRHTADVMHRLKLNRKSLQDNLDYQDKMNGVLNDASDREGSALLRQVKKATQFAHGVAHSEEEAVTKGFQNQIDSVETSQSELAAQIAGMPDPNAKASKEVQNLMLANAKAAACISSGAYNHNAC